MGAKLLFNAGAVDDQRQVKKTDLQTRMNPEIMKILTAIELNHLPIAERLALNQQFMDANPFFLLSGQAIRVAVEKGHLEFTEKLREAGYAIPKTILVDAIREQNEKMIKNIIAGQLYRKEDGLELDFWYLLYRGWEPYAKDLLALEPSLEPYVTVFDPPRLIESDELIAKALKFALEQGLDDIASVMISIKPSAISAELIKLALERHDLDFLRKVYTGNHSIKEGTVVKKRNRRSVLWQELDKKSTRHEKKEVIKHLKVAFILEHLLKTKRLSEARRVLEWPDACNEEEVLHVCMQFGDEELAREVMRNRKQGIASKDLELCFEKKAFRLAMDIVKWKEARVYLNHRTTQKALIDLLSNGSTCYYASEMLSWIPTKHWNLDLTRNLAETITHMVKKTEEILKSHHPLLFLVLMCEFFLRLVPVSLEHKTRCERMVDILQDFASEIEDTIKEENELKYFLTQQDTRSRTVLTIISRNRFYELLEDEDVGSIVSKLWVGSKKNYGILGASTIIKAWDAPSASDEALCFMRRMDKSKPYMFHFEQWTESCSLRFLAQAISTTLLVIFYTLMVHLATVNNVLGDVAANSTTLVLLRISQVWIAGIFTEQLLHIAFGLRTKRGYFFDGWKLVDFLMFAQMLILMLELNKKITGPGNYFSNVDPTQFNTVLHAIMLILIWMKLLSVMVTTKSLGPFLRMLLLMVQDMTKFLIVALTMVFGFAAIFTSLFQGCSENGDFDTFLFSYRYLFGTMLTDFSFGFTCNVRYGDTMISLFVILMNGLMINLLAALLTNIYEALSVRVDSEHRSVLIAYYNKWYWSDSYGMLILLPSPLSFLSLACSPLVLFTSTATKWNYFLCKLFYLLYAFPQFCIFFLASLLYIPLTYFQSFLSYGRTGKKEYSGDDHLFKNKVLPQNILEVPDHVESEDAVHIGYFSVKKSIIWTFIGLPILVVSLLRDCYDFWKEIYRDLDAMNQESDKTKLQSMVTERSIKDLQKVIRHFEGFERVQIPEFLMAWIEEDSKQLNPALLDDQSALESRKKLLNEYLYQFAISRKTPELDLQVMKTLLPKQNYYPESYIIHAIHVNVPWMNKAVHHFHQRMGSIKIQGILIPKSLISSETAELKDLDLHYKRVNTNYARLAADSQNMVQDMGKLTQMYKNILD